MESDCLEQYYGANLTLTAIFLDTANPSSWNHFRSTQL